jgi:hypothetical protein
MRGKNLVVIRHQTTRSEAFPGTGYLVPLLCPAISRAWRCATALPPESCSTV